MAPTKAPVKAPEPVSAAKEVEIAPAAKDDMKASFSSDLEKTKQAQRIAKGAMTVAASKMFLFYSNLLSPESSTHGTRSSASRWKATLTSTFKVTL
jgi:hypothetical protein